MKGDTYAAPPDDRPLTPPVRGTVRLRTLVMLRWFAAAGQMATVLVVQFGLGFELPLAACFAAIAASIGLNLAMSVRLRLSRLARPQEAMWQLAFDISQLALILGLTGGLENPYVVILAAPVVIGAATLPGRMALSLAVFALSCTAAIAVLGHPLPWSEGQPLILPAMYVFGLWTALVITMAFAGLTAWRASAEAARNALALTATQAVLAREQRLAAIGGIAAAAAHELGTPLATIQLTAKEMARAIPEDSPLADDARLLVQQAERCRDILGQLSRRGDEADAGIARADFRTLLEEIAEPFRHFGAEIDISVSGPGRMPDLTRAPEIIYGLGNIVENAVDFAAARVTVTGVWTGRDVTVTIEDDGEGFDPEVLAKLGEPYVSTREGAADAGGMGLGVFIADTLISRTGGKITFSNTASGARAVAVWPLSAIQAPPYSPSADPQPI